MNWTALLLIISGVCAYLLQMRYFLDNDKEGVSRFGLHWAGGILHVWTGATLAIIASLPYGVLFGSLTWLFFDGYVNTFIFGKGWYYIGDRAPLDRAIRWLCKRRNVYWINPEAAAGILKILLVAGSIIWLIVKIYA